MAADSRLFDPKRKFVRLRQLRPDGFVEFDFAIGEPELFVEMILGAAAFDDFCASNGVQFLAPESAASPALDAGFDWRLRNAARPHS
ncbi:phenol hydroxylase subunit [Derxia lacustris]|uniref:phenol hydroxylase subunit n=1 Tax=Derxia lacustris TaxID=764842 RepID=UPI000A175D2F|nr:phenol hydroxylase subunit [Derxia lacustris]